METFLVVSLILHRKYGIIPEALLVEPARNQSYHQVVQALKNRNEVLSTPLTGVAREVALLASEISDEHIQKVFEKKGPRKKPLDIGDTVFVAEQILPYIHRRFNLILAKSRSAGLQVYRRKEKSRHLYFSDQLTLPAEPAGVVFHVIKKEDGTYYTLQIQTSRGEISLFEKNATILTAEPCHLLLGDQIYHFGEGEDAINGKVLTPFFQKDYIFIRKDLEEKFFSGFFQKIIRKHRVISEGFNLIVENPACTPTLSLRPDLAMRPRFYLEFRYEGHPPIPYGQSIGKSVSVDQNLGTFRQFRRDGDFEAACGQQVINMGLVHEVQALFQLPGIDVTGLFGYHELIQWLQDHQADLDKAGFVVQSGWENKQFWTGAPILDFRQESSRDWFDLQIKVRVREFEIPFIEFRDHILQENREFQLPDGSFFLIPTEWFSQYRNLLIFGERRGNGFRLKKNHHGILNQITPLKAQPDPEEKGSNPEGNPALPALLKGTLRPYQAAGFAWLYHLYNQGFGGCLADDMGLGKTIQAIALLCHAKETLQKDGGTSSRLAYREPDLFSDFFREPAPGLPSLVVCPTSLIHNWINELKTFSPTLRVYPYTGPGRKVPHFPKSEMGAYDIVLTTYGLIRNDFEDFQTMEFHLIILDESQFIKNPFSKAYQALLHLPATHRFVLTGTPIENSLNDLWAQMHFINRGILGTPTSFRQYFANPIEKNGKQDIGDHLRELIRPFILRRTKQEVTPDLPVLTEQTLYCEMTPAQESLYEKEKSKIRNTILESIDNQGFQKSAFVILRGLTLLRQIASHPALFDPDYREGSGKFEEITRSLEVVLEENHKVLIFSPFVRHLDLLAAYLRKRGTRFSTLTGKTHNREEVIKGFRGDPGIKVFLISLKAGGFGLNLPEADYVFILDPWWNPAVEDQAVSRSHRIGQTMSVFAYRFLTEGSIEEKIHRLQTQKSQLAGSFVHTNNPFKAFNQSEITELLT